jgi:hypothetical protein
VVACYHQAARDWLFDPASTSEATDDSVNRPLRFPGLHFGMPMRRFPILDDLICRIEKTAASRPDPVQTGATVIRLIGDRGADPYLLIGVLAEGAIHTLVKHIPSERRPDTAEALVKIVTDRLKDHGLGQ